MSSMASEMTTILGIRRNWWMLAVILPMHILLGLSSTIIDIPKPIIIAELDSDRYRFQWVTGATLIGTLVGMAMIRWLRDRFGLRIVFLTGMMFFTAASGACGLAQSDDFLAVARCFEGFGKGMAVATILATFYRELPEHPDLAMALYGIGIYFGKAIAPALAGYLMDYPSWRWVFYLNVPAGLFTIIAAWWVLLPDRPDNAPHDPFDFTGLALLVLWLVPLMICLYRGQKWGWWTSNGWVFSSACFVLALAAFIAWELHTRFPLIDLHLFKKRTFFLAQIIKSFFAINFYTVISLLSSYMVVLRAYPRTTTGLVLLPGAMAMGLSMIVGALLAHRVDRKTRLLWGMMGMAIGTWMFTSIDLYTDKRWLAAVFVLWSTGAGLVVSPIICLPMEGLSQTQIVSSASIKNMVRSLPSAVGGSLLATLLTRRTDIYFDSLRQNIVSNRAVAEDTVGRLGEHVSFMGAGVDRVAPVVSHEIGAFVHANAQAFAYQTVLQYLALCCVAAFVFGLLIKSPEKGKRVT